MSALQRLKEVSGQLRRIFTGQDEQLPPKRLGDKLLIVDDEESICFSMKEYFLHHGFHVDTARELHEAEDLISKTNYGVLIQDLRLGVSRDSSGLDLISQVHKRNPETVIIVLTSFGTQEAETAAMDAGADVFLRKPKPLSQVAQVIEGLMQSPHRTSRFS